MREGLDEHPTVVTIQREWRRLNETLDSLTPEQMERPAFDPEFGGTPWTVKDLLVHIAAWKRNTIRVIDLVRADPASVPESGTPDDILKIDFEAFNQEQQARWASCSLDEALTEHRAAHDELLAALASIPPEQIPEPTTRNIWPYPAIWHTRMHRLDILVALER
jgi:DinB family protein